MPQPRQAQAQAETPFTPRQGREGNRWYNVPPTPEDFVEWFKSVPIHDDLKPEDYVGGIVLIQQKQAHKEVIDYNRDTGAPVVREVEHQLFTPHPTVSTRIRYFEDLKARHSDWVAVYAIDPAMGAPVAGLPDGFFRYVAEKDNRPTSFVGCSIRLRIFRKRTTEFVDVEQGPVDALVRRRVVEGELIAEFAPGSKIVPVIGRFGADENAIMKAQTGAIGRALGMAGMLVIPGSGIATSEDMHEVLSGENRVGEGGSLPDVVGPSAAPVVEEPRAKADRLEAELAQRDGTAHAKFVNWLAERQIDFKTASGGDLTTVIKALERQLGSS